MKNEQLFESQTSAQRAMMEILDDERRRISTDLHDNIQNKLRLLRDKFTENEPLRTEIDFILEEIRRVAFQLVPKNLQEFSLRDYLNIYETVLNQTYIKKFKTDYRTNVEKIIPKNIETQLFSIMHEATNNVIKYANTPALMIRYHENAESLMLLIQDFGDGFDVEKAQHQKTIGIKGMKTRCELMGAKLEIESDPLQGTKVKITIPIKEIEDFRNHQPMEDAPKKEKEEDSNRKKLKDDSTILIVDNQIEYLEALKNQLSKAHSKMKILTAFSVHQAKEIFEKQNIDILITDITMPDASGIELVEFVNGKYPRTTIMLHTVNDSPAYIFRAQKVLNVKFYIWKETKDEKPILKALENLETEYLSSEIKEINKTFNLKNYDYEKDSSYRKLFKNYMQFVKEGELDKTKLHEKTTKILEYHMSKETMQKYIQRYKLSSGFKEESEVTKILLRFSEDFGLLK